MKERDDSTKQDWTGNEVRAMLVKAGLPKPNQKLIDTLAPAVLIDKKGATLRRWRYSRAEIMPIIEEMKPDFFELEALSYGDNGVYVGKLEEVTRQFYSRLATLQRF